MVYAKALNNEGTAITLKEHSEAVAKKARELALTLTGDDRIGNLLYVAGLLHDVGKATSHMQDYFTGKSSGEPSPYHSEIGWMWISTQAAQIKQYLKDNAAVPEAFCKTPSVCVDILAKSVFYHHARHVQYDDDHKEIDTVSDLTEHCSEYVQEMNSSYANEEFHMEFDNDVQFDGKVPELKSSGATGSQSSVADGLLYLVRTILVHADHMVSGNLSDGKSFSAYPVPNMPEGWDAKRYGTSKEIALGITGSSGIKNHVINAPAGFGKTSIAYLTALMSSNRTVIACPTKFIADGLYDSLNELENLFGTRVGIELVYGGKRQKASCEDSMCKISVGTIDTFVGTFVKGKNMGNAIEGSDICAYDILSSNVVFDEYHELLDNNALFALFVNILSARTVFVKDAKTVLMSATPVNLRSVAPVRDGENTQYYPSRNEAYPAQHDKEYTLCMVDSVPENLPDDTFAIFNTVKEAQKHMANGNTICHHAKFTKEDRARNEMNLFRHHGKHGSVPVSVSASPIMQASVDVSADTLYESTAWFTNTVQRIGRCNRWGRDEKAAIKLYFSTDATENMTRFKEKSALADSWRKFVSENVHPNMTVNLDWIYKELYFKFCSENNEQIDAYTTECYKEGRQSLASLFPKASGQYKDETSKEISVDGLRGDAKCNCALYCKEDGKWIGTNHQKDPNDIPFSIEYETVTRLLDKVEDMDKWLGQLLKTYPGSFSGIEEYVGYKSVIGKVTKKKFASLIKNFASFSKDSDYPVPVPEGMGTYDHRVGAMLTF